MESVTRILCYGLGPIGCHIVRIAHARPGLEIVGAVDVDPAKIGRDVGQVAGLREEMGIRVAQSLAEIGSASRAELAIQATTSSLSDLMPQLEELFKAGLRVVSTSEELSYPNAQDPDLGKKIDVLAKQCGVAVLGTGVNPGFAMDTLVLALTGVCADIHRIDVFRVVDSSTRRVQLQVKTGAGLSVAEFEKRASEGKIRHIGLEESLAMVADHIGWKLDRTESSIEPVVAEKVVRSTDILVPVGNVAGVRQCQKGISCEKALITMNLEISIGAPNPCDHIVIRGSPDIDMVITGGIQGDIATAAIAVNAIPRVMTAAPGLLNMAELPLVFARVGESSAVRN